MGIGASAGGLESLESLFANLEPDLGMAYVVIQHLSASHRSMMPELLARVTAMPVTVASDGAAILANTINLIPPGQFLTIADGRFHLEPKPAPPTLTLPIDRFFESLAVEWGDAAVCVVLSGTGTDGTRGAQRVRAAGGLVMAEDPATARFDGMPRSVIDGQAVDVVIPAGEIGRYLARLAPNAAFVEPPADGSDAVDPIERIVRLLHDDTGVDFEKYKRATVSRRVARRMVANDLSEPEDYLTLIAASEAERELLYRELLIRVTSFFRDPDMWEALSQRVIAPLIASTNRHDSLRMWVPACSTGEEAYTLAMVMLDEMERQDRYLELKVFATDIDREGLDVGARGRYREAQLGGVSDERLARYFNRSDGAYVVSAQLRKCVMFAHHNVTRDAPFTRLDMVSCRNLFIYLNNELQSRVLGAFHFALKPGATLVLGSSETLGEQTDRFVPVDSARKIFRSIGERRATAWVGEVRDAPRRVVSERAFVGATKPAAEVDAALAMLAERYAPAGVLVDVLGQVRHIFGDVSAYLRLPAGSAELNVLEMSRPELSAALAAGFPRAMRTGEPTSFAASLGDTSGGAGSVVVGVLPLVDVGVNLGVTGAVVVFEPSSDRSEQHLPEVDPIRVQLEELHEELRRARRGQQRLVEQLESSNEELQATNEEMVAANEELQATNEELQSVNEELFTVNAENARRIHELEVVRNDLDHLLAATDVGTLVVDRDLMIRRFTPSVSEFLPILERDVGRPITHLANSLGGPDFLDEVRHVIATGDTCERSIDSVHGPVLVRMIPYRMREMEGVLITFVDVTTVKRNFEVSRRVLDALPAHVAFLDRVGNITMVNQAWEDFSSVNGGVPERTGPGTNYFTVCIGSDETRQVAEGIRAVLARRVPSFTHVYPCHPSEVEERWFLLQCTPAGPDEAVVVHFDITTQKQAERLLMGLATHDPLTGVLNRRGVEAELDVVIRRARRSGRTACALMLDCDDFKRVNDRVGHAGGDAVLRAVTRRIESTLRAGDSLARIGGDEFLVLLPEASMEAAHVAAERVRTAVASEPVAVSHDDISLTVSVSVVPLDEEIFTLEHLIDRSRAGLQSSKEHGKNMVTDGGAPSRTTSSRSVLAAMLEGQQLAVAVQPIVTTSAGEIVGVELLTRSLATPAMTPMMLFRLAMEEGMLSVVDEAVLQRCLDMALSIRHPGSRHVNLYPSTLLAMSPGQIDRLFAGRSSFHNPLVVELSEQQLLGDPADLLANLSLLRAHGVQVALDDVGFGHTSLETLIVVEPQIIKLDVTCIRGVDTDDEQRRRLRRLVQVSRTLGSTIVAEGVESEAEVRVIDELDIEWCQGYFFAEPVVMG